MLYYQDQAEGFRPSLAVVEATTGIPSNKVSEIRHELVLRGMIGYDGNTILIDWQRMRIYAALQERLPKRGVHNPITARRSYACDKSRQQVLAYPENETQEVFRILGRMTKASYSQMIADCAASMHVAKVKLVTMPDIRQDFIIRRNDSVEVYDKTC